MRCGPEPQEEARQWGRGARELYAVSYSRLLTIKHEGLLAFLASTGHLLTGERIHAATHLGSDAGKPPRGPAMNGRDASGRVPDTAPT